MMSRDPYILREATGQSDLEGAVAWIAEGHTLRAEVDHHELLQALVALDLTTTDVREAIRRVARTIAKSSLDPASVICLPEAITPSERYRHVLDLLAWKSPTRTLARVTADAVTAAQREDPFTMEVLCGIAGLSYRDLRDRLGDVIPSEPSGHWTTGAVLQAFRVIDAIVRGKETSDIPGAIPACPIELLLQRGRPVSADEAWGLIEEMRSGGIPYEILLAQRAVGSAWGTHRNRTSSALVPLVAARLCHKLDQLSIRYRRSTSVGGTIRPAEIKRLAGGDGQIGLVILATDGQPVCAVAFSVARDGGTARKNAARLHGLVRSTRVPVAVVVAGPGWASRNETADLAVAFDGRLYSDTSVSKLAAAIGAALDRHAERGETGNGHIVRGGQTEAD